MQTYVSSGKIKEGNLVTEKYSILGTTSKVVSLMYQYNPLGSHHNYKRYYLISLLNGHILSYSDIYQKPELLLKKCNLLYRKKINQKLNNMDNSQAKITLQNHLNNFKGFKPIHLENIELAIDNKTHKIYKALFHYPDIANRFNPVLPQNHIKLDINALKPL